MEQESESALMVRRLKLYLNGEQQLGIAFVGVGVLALSIGGGMFYLEVATLYRALSWMLLLTGAVQLLYGGGILWTAVGLKQRLPLLVEQAPRDFVAIELQRLAQIDQQYKIKQSAGMGLFLLGMLFVLLPVFGVLGQWQLGLGLGLCLQVGVLIVLELYRYWQTGMYRHEVKRFGGKR